MDAQKVYERRWKILAVMSLSLVITLLNNVTVNVALPELSKDLGADNTELQWIMAVSYTHLTLPTKRIV